MQKSSFTIVKLKIMNRKNYPGLSGKALHVIMRVLIREWQRKVTDIQRRQDTKMEADTDMIRPQAQRCQVR
jgi:hypothetical protein